MLKLSYICIFSSGLILAGTQTTLERFVAPVALAVHFTRHFLFEHKEQSYVKSDNFCLQAFVRHVQLNHLEPHLLWVTQLEVCVSHLTKITIIDSSISCLFIRLAAFWLHNFHTDLISFFF